MGPRRARATVAALVAAASLVAGCGGDTEARNAYVDDVRDAQEAFVGRFDRVRDRLTETSTPEQDGATLDEFASIAERFATQLRGIRPPDAVREQHDRLVSIVGGYRAAVAEARKDARAGGAVARARVRTDLAAAVGETQTKLTAAIKDLNVALRE